MSTDDAAAVTGPQLRAEREAADVKAYEIAIEMRVHASRISQIEALAEVTPGTVERYRAALVAIASPVANTTPQAPVEAA